MKFFTKKLIYMYAIVLIAVSTLCIGCNNNEDSVPSFDANREYTTDLEKSLAAFADRHAELMETLLTSASSSASRSMDEKNEAQLFNDLDENLEQIFAQHDVQQELQGKADQPCVDEDSLEMMKLDTDMFLAYIKERHTTTFYTLCKQLIDTGTLNVSEKEIILNPELQLEEKIKLLVVLPAFSQNELGLTRVKTRSESSDPCYEAYRSDRTGCGLSFLADCVAACLEAALGGGIGMGAAIWTAGKSSYDLINCLDDARDDYINCQSRL